MQKNIFLMGIAILLSARVQASDVLPEKTPENLSDTLTLQEVTVKASFSNVSNSALRLVTIDDQALKFKTASRTYPEMLSGIPSLYATSESGSYGDAKLNIRGFAQENISVLLNGIPISG
ncbi:MAG: Plug domain-containing protein, partial [Bacteroidales bacterium]|nr:Plug domain-containing protein [Bacteroidales bacterium]